jgi:Ser/Thr protein kinase RdoA (MazF antagonist)
VTVQTWVGGPPFASPAAAAAEAGEVLARLHGESSAVLRSLPPVGQLDIAAASARLVAQIAPALRPRLDRLLRRLEATMPVGLAPVTAHGDFNSRQLIDSAHGLVVTDFDSMCTAPAAIDIATYLSYLVRGDESDLPRAFELLDPLLEGYGERPQELSWYLATMILRRSPRPFRYQDEHWPERVEQMVAATERLAL